MIVNQIYSWKTHRRGSKFIHLPLSNRLSALVPFFLGSKASILEPIIRTFTAREEKKRQEMLETTFGRETGKFEIAGNLEITLTTAIRWRRTCANRVRTSMQLGNNCVGGQPRGPLDNWFPLTSLSRLPLKRHPRTANWHSVYPLAYLSLFPPDSSFFCARYAAVHGR